MSPNALSTNETLLRKVSSANAPPERFSGCSFCKRLFGTFLRMLFLQTPLRKASPDTLLKNASPKHFSGRLLLQTPLRKAFSKTLLCNLLRDALSSRVARCERHYSLPFGKDQATVENRRCRRGSLRASPRPRKEEGGRRAAHARFPSCLLRAPLRGGTARVSAKGYTSDAGLRPVPAGSAAMPSARRCSRLRKGAKGTPPDRRKRATDTERRGTGRDTETGKDDWTETKRGAVRPLRNPR